ncbi:LADA_0A01002g1_1 [Lachancea dasiensis]|uniref:LADA_0A01002g1_1 n=1 Tax=Lachancea dasiensis TaxID=1072105 RepID=A0A1G4IMD9_9SACH|nr:LADA_0A01002g1_1 [Lachancea dasiensis]
MAGKALHRKFDDQAQGLENIPSEIPEQSVADDHSSEDDASSDDEAPEEEGVVDAKSQIEGRELERQRAAKKEQDLIKDKRRKQNLIFAKQQDEKRTKQFQDFELLMKQRELENGASSDEEIPEELPEGFFENLDEQASHQIATKPTHVNFNDIDENFTPEVKAELKKQKKKTLNKLRKTTLKRGPVTVNLLATMASSRSLAPKKDPVVLNKKDKWLKRKSLGRR